MSGLLDDPPEPVPVQIALIVEGEYPDKPTAYGQVNSLLLEIDHLLAARFPQLRIERAEVGYGEADDDAAG